MPRRDMEKRRKQIREAVRRFRVNHPERASQQSRESMRKAITENPQKFRERALEWKKNHPECEKNYQKSNPLMRPAQYLAQKNIQVSKCEKCSTTKNLQRHHSDYSKPLEVQVLCVRCHNAVHHSLLVELNNTEKVKDDV